MATLTSSLILSLIDKVTAPARGIAASVATMQGKLEANNRRLDAMRGRMVEVTAVGYGLYRAIRGPIMAAVEFESAMADVRKVVDFETPQAFKQMGADIIEMSTRIPIAANGIANIVAAAGQAGMAGNELLAFTEIAAKVGVAFDMTAGEVGQALAEIKTQLNLSVEETGVLADAINHLSNTSASSAPKIVAFMRTVAATGEYYGFTATETAAIGSAMIAAGAQSEVAATSFRNVGRALAKGASASTRQKDAFFALGLSATDVAKRFNEDAVGTLRDVIVRINELPSHLRANTLSEIFGDEARALAPLVTQIELYDKALGSVADQAKYLGSSQREFETRSETTANSMQLFSNKVTAAGIAIGSSLLPALNGIMDALGPVALAIARFADANPRLTSTVVALTAGLVGLRIAAIAAQWSFFWMRGAYLSTAIAGLKGVGAAVAAATGAMSIFGTRTKVAGRAAFSGFSMANAAALSAGKAADASKAMIAGMSATALANANASRQMTAGMTAASGAITGAGGSFRRYAAALASTLVPMRLVTAASKALKIALISTGIGAILVGIAMAGAWIYQNWSGIAEMFRGIGEGIRNAFPGAGAIIDTVSSAVETLFGWFNRITGPIDASAASWRAFGVSIGESIGGFVADIAAFPGQVRAALQPLIDFFANLTIPAPSFENIIAAFNALVDGIRSAVTAIEGLVRRASRAVSSIGAFGSTAAGAGSANANPLQPIMPGDVPGRATGGPVSGNSLYRVGERGPEFFVPPVDGRIINARDTAAMIAGMNRGVDIPAPQGLPAVGSSGGAHQPRSQSITFGNIIVQGGASATASDIANEFRRAVRDAIDGGQFDTTHPGF